MSLEDMGKREKIMSYWKNKRVFITGANGFVGSHLAISLMEKGAYVMGLIIDRISNSYLKLCGREDRLNIIWGSIHDYDLLERALNEYEIDTCFHLAAQAIVTVSNRSPLSTFRTNIMGTWNILEASRRIKTVKRVVIASSDKAYGEQEKLPYIEDMELLGRNPYDVSKTCADILAQSYYKSFLLPVGITRCANIYGPGDLNFNRIIPDTIRSLIFNNNPIIRSDGTYLRDYIYVKDVIKAYILLAENLDNPDLHGEAFNFGNESPISVLDLVNLITKISGKPKLKPNILGTSKLEIKEQYLSSQKSKKILNWKNDFSIEDGLKETYSWYQEFLLKNKKK